MGCGHLYYKGDLIIKIYGLLDCNNFYASCERIFNPKLRARPLVILSNNDGCIIARSREAKQLGISMGEPAFKCEHIIRQHNVLKRSANFALYGDLSNRVMSVIAEMVADLEVYSIDEAFFELGDSVYDSPEQACYEAKSIQAQVERSTGVPVSIGVATTKTLAKLANKIAKRDRLGVFSLYLGETDLDLLRALIDSSLSEVDVSDIWGIGRGYTSLLYQHRIKTALDLKYTSDRWIKANMGVGGLRTAMELRGLPCISLDNREKPNQSIISSRSFGAKVTSLGSLQEALANFVAVAAYKLRSQRLLTNNLQVYLKAERGIQLSGATSFNTPTAYTPSLIKAAHQVLDDIYVEGYSYKKAGVVLSDLSQADNIQLNLLDLSQDVARDSKLNDLADGLNDYFGVNTIFWAAMGSKCSGLEQEWRPQQSHRSPMYTTDWRSLPKVF